MLNGYNYGMWTQDIKTLLNIKTLWLFIKIVVPYPKNEHEKFMVNGKKEEIISVMATYISREIQFHTSGIDYLNEVWKKLKKLFNKVDESYVMYLEKK